MASESKIQGKIIKYLKEQGAYVVKVVLANRAGIPDLLVCLNGRFIGIEVKEGKNQPSPLQQMNMERIRQSGGSAYPVWSLEDVKRVITDLQS